MKQQKKVGGEGIVEADSTWPDLTHTANQLSHNCLDSCRSGLSFFLALVVGYKGSSSSSSPNKSLSFLLLFNISQGNFDLMLFNVKRSVGKLSKWDFMMMSKLVHIHWLLDTKIITEKKGKTDIWFCKKGYVIMTLKVLYLVLIFTSHGKKNLPFSMSPKLSQHRTLWFSDEIFLFLLFFLPCYIEW